MRATKSLKRIRSDLRPRQTTLFDMPEEPKPQPPAVMPLEFKGKPVRTIMIGSESWWVAKDACAVLEIKNHSHAVHGNPSRDGGGLDDDEKGVYLVTTPSGPQQMLCVSEPGLLRLIVKSNKPEAAAFRRWVFHEVLPSIRKTGRYVSPKAKNLTPLQKARDENRKQNIKDHARIFAAGGNAQDCAAHHNAIYHGQFGLSAKALRDRLNVSDTPLNHMDEFCLFVNGLAKVTAEKRREAAEAAGVPVPLNKQPSLNHAVSQRVTADALATLGSEYQQNVIDTPKGKILGVERRSLGNPDRLAPALGCPQ